MMGMGMDVDVCDMVMGICLVCYMRSCALFVYVHMCGLYGKVNIQECFDIGIVGSITTPYIVCMLCARIVRFQDSDCILISLKPSISVFKPHTLHLNQLCCMNIHITMYTYCAYATH